MKKILALLLAVSMVFALAACGNNDGAKKEDAPTGVKMNLETLHQGLTMCLKQSFTILKIQVSQLSTTKQIVSLLQTKAMNML